MVSGNKKSRTFRRVSVKTPGGNTVRHYRRRKPGFAKCAITGQNLMGVPRDIPANIKKLSKSERKPSRPFGGNLSSEGMRLVLEQRCTELKLATDDVKEIVKVGRVCMKIAGRDAGELCVIVEKIDDKFVTIDGGVRRRKCNLNHLQPLKKVIKIKAKASHEDVAKEFEALKLKVWTTKPKAATEKPKKVRKGKVAKKVAAPKKAPVKKVAAAKKE